MLCTQMKANFRFEFPSCLVLGDSDQGEPFVYLNAMFPIGHRIRN